MENSLSTAFYVARLNEPIVYYWVALFSILRTCMCTNRPSIVQDMVTGNTADVPRYTVLDQTLVLLTLTTY